MDFKNHEPIMTDHNEQKKPRPSPAEMEERLIHHEVGHLVMNSLVRKLNIVSCNGLRFREPKFIEVNFNTGSGVVEWAGFPIYDFTSNYVTDQEPEFVLEGAEFYKRNKNFFAANFLISMAGYLVESWGCRKDRLVRFGSFANEDAQGEKDDKDNCLNLFTKVVGNKNTITADPNVIQMFEEFGQSCLPIIKDIFKSVSFWIAIDYVCDRLREEPIVNGIKKINGERFRNLLTDIDDRLD